MTGNALVLFGRDGLEMLLAPAENGHLRIIITQNREEICAIGIDKPGVEKIAAFLRACLVREERA